MTLADSDIVPRLDPVADLNAEIAKTQRAETVAGPQHFEEGEGFDASKCVTLADSDIVPRLDPVADLNAGRKDAEGR